MRRTTGNKFLFRLLWGGATKSPANTTTAPNLVKSSHHAPTEGATKSPGKRSPSTKRWKTEELKRSKVMKNKAVSGKQQTKNHHPPASSSRQRSIRDAPPAETIIAERVKTRQPLADVKATTQAVKKAMRRKQDKHASSTSNNQDASAPRVVRTSASSSSDANVDVLRTFQAGAAASKPSKEPEVPAGSKPSKEPEVVAQVRNEPKQQPLGCAKPLSASSVKEETNQVGRPEAPRDSPSSEPKRGKEVSDPPHLSTQAWIDGWKPFKQPNVFTVVN